MHSKYRVSHTHTHRNMLIIECGETMGCDYFLTVRISARLFIIFIYLVYTLQRLQNCMIKSALLMHFVLPRRVSEDANTSWQPSNPKCKLIYIYVVSPFISFLSSALLPIARLFYGRWNTLASPWYTESDTLRVLHEAIDPPPNIFGDMDFPSVVESVSVATAGRFADDWQRIGKGTPNSGEFVVLSKPFNGNWFLRANGQAYCYLVRFSKYMYLLCNKIFTTTKNYTQSLTRLVISFMFSD